MTPDNWYMTHDTCHVTCDTWPVTDGGRWTLSPFRSLALRKELKKTTANYPHFVTKDQGSSENDCRLDV